MHQIAKIQTALPTGSNKLLDKVAEALAPSIDDTPRPQNWIDRQQARASSVTIKTSSQHDVARTLMDLGVYRCTEGQAVALLEGGQRVSTDVLNTALSRIKASVSDRLRLKTALDRFNRLPK